MRSSRHCLTVLLVAALSLRSIAQPPPRPLQSPAVVQRPGARRPAVLGLTAVAGWEHDSVASATALMELHAEHRGWDLTLSSDVNDHFNTSASLRDFDVIVFLLTSGSIFSDAQRTAFRAYVEQGGAVVGVHSALDTNRDWPFHVNLLGAEFIGHPDVQWASMQTLDREHPTTSFLPRTWEIEEEYYNFAQPLRLNDKHILLAVDEESYEGGAHGSLHPMSWTSSFAPVGSRVWVTALGHSEKIFSSYEWPARQFQLHLALGVEWAANGTVQARQRAEEIMKDLSFS